MSTVDQFAQTKPPRKDTTNKLKRFKLVSCSFDTINSTAPVKAPIIAAGSVPGIKVNALTAATAFVVDSGSLIINPIIE